MKPVKLFEEFIEEDIVSFIKNVADKAKSLVNKTVSLNKKTDTIKKKAERAKQKKTPEGNLEVALSNNQLQQAKIDSQKIKLQQAELKIKQQIEKTKEVEAQQREKQGQQPKTESINVTKHIKLFEEFVDESNSNKSFEYKGYFCSIIKKNESEDLWHCSVYKGTKIDENNYVMGVKGLLPLEEAIDTVKRYIDEKMNEDVGQIFSDGMDQTLRTGYKVELMTGDTGVIIDLIGTDEAIVLLGNGVTARVNPQGEIKQVIDTTEPTKSNGRFMS